MKTVKKLSLGTGNSERLLWGRYAEIFTCGQTIGDQVTSWESKQQWMSRSPMILPANFSVQRTVRGSGCWPFRWLCNGRATPCQQLCHLHCQVSLSSVSYSQPSREPGHIYDPHPSSSHAPIIPPLDTSTCSCFQLPSFLWHLAWVTPKLRAHRNELRPDSWNQSVSTSGGFRPYKGRYRLSLWYSNTKVTPPLSGEWSSENVAAMCLYWKKYH